MYGPHRISVVFPSYNEREYIQTALRDFSLPFVDELIVIDNNSCDGTGELAARMACRVVRETRQGYGHAIMRGLDEATGDYIIVAEPDGTFSGRDMMKLIVYADDFDFVIGTRTLRELVHPGANMGWFIRIGNWAVGKMLYLLFGGPRLSDVGCTFRLIRREALQKIRGQLNVGGSHFSPAMMSVAILNGLRMVEVPVNYHRRTGESTITGRKSKALRLGMRMIAFLVCLRIKTLFRQGGAA